MSLKPQDAEAALAAISAKLDTIEREVAAIGKRLVAQENAPGTVRIVSGGPGPPEATNGQDGASDAPPAPFPTCPACGFPHEGGSDDESMLRSCVIAGRQRELGRVCASCGNDPFPGCGRQALKGGRAGGESDE